MRLFLIEKSKVCEMFKKFKTMVEETKQPIKVVRFDGEVSTYKKNS